MSVKVADRTVGQLTVLVKAKELAAHTLKAVHNEKYFPKRHKFTVTNKIVDYAFDIFMLLNTANETFPNNAEELQKRLNLQREAMAKCKTMAATLDICKEAFCIPASKVSYWCKLIYDTRSLIYGWYRKDQERFKF